MKVRLVILFAVVALFATASFAATITLLNTSGSASIGTPLPAGYAGPVAPGGAVGGWDQGPFLFTLPKPGTLDIEIQDCCIVGDIYDPILNGIDLGHTALVPLNGPTLSMGGFILFVGPGGYNLNVGDRILSFIGFPDPYGGGVVGSVMSPAGLSMQVYYTPTPEPGSLMLLGTGIVGLAGVVRRKLML